MTSELGPPPASAAWRPGSAVGARKFASLFGAGGLRLEAGGRLPSVNVAYETWGHLDDNAGNAVLVLHALTGDSHAAGPAGPGHFQSGWWDALIGPGRAIDTNQWYVVCPNVLGGCQGTTGPASLAPDGRPYAARFPRITIRDQVRVEAALADVLGIRRWAAVVGGSMGGMRALEWAVSYPDQVNAAVLLATSVSASAEQIALSSIQVQAVQLDPKFGNGDYYDAWPGGGPHAGMGLARRLGQVSYRSETELAERFGRHAQPGEEPLAGGRFAVESYLDHHAEKLARRFDANSYIVLNEAMNLHDAGRGRGGAASALAGVGAAVTVIGIDSDRLYPLRLQAELARLLPGRPEVALVTSTHGHDAFLIEAEQVGKIITAALERQDPDSTGPS